MSGGYSEQGVGWSGQQTSKDAADDLNPSAARKAVLACLKENGAMADWELQIALRWPLTKRVTPRRRECVIEGLIRATDVTVPNPESGKHGLRWTIVPPELVNAYRDHEAAKAGMCKCPDCGKIFTPIKAQNHVGPNIEDEDKEPYDPEQGWFSE